MQKPVINYKGYMTDNPSDRTKPKICIPQIVDRNQVQTLEQVVAHAIDRGLIAGLKSSAAKSIADGIMLQLGETLNGGTGVIFGEFFAVRPYLTGTIANLLAPITTANKLRVRFVPGSAYKLDEKNFSFHNVTQSENLPNITGVQPSVSGAAEFTFDVNENLAVIGHRVKFRGIEQNIPRFHLRQNQLQLGQSIGESIHPHVHGLKIGECFFQHLRIIPVPPGGTGGQRDPPGLADGALVL